MAVHKIFIKQQISNSSSWKIRRCCADDEAKRDA